MYVLRKHGKYSNCYVRDQSRTKDIGISAYNKVKHRVISLSKKFIFNKITPIPKMYFVPIYDMMGGTFKAHMRCVGQTDPQIQRSKVPSPLTKAEAKVSTLTIV